MTQPSPPPSTPAAPHPRDRFLTVYGRKPVLEALRTPGVRVDKLLVAHNAHGDAVQELLQAAHEVGVKAQRVAPKQVTRLSRNQRQDQGVVADVLAPRMAALDATLAAPLPRRWAGLLLDGVTTPANVGMVLRAATGAGLEGIVLPRAGSPEVGPLVIKASAGVAFNAPILRAATASEAAAALVAAGVTLVGLRMDGADDLYASQWPDRVCFVLGNETHGVSAEVAAHTTRWARIPMAAGVESLNVATAGAVVAFELMRRRRL